MLALVTLAYVLLNFGASLWLRRPEHNRSSVPLLVSTLAFGALWFLLRGAPRSPAFIRAVELSTLFVGTAAISTMAVIMDLIAEPDMIVRSLLIDVLLVYAVYVPSSARHTLVVASLMTLPLLRLFTPVPLEPSTAKGGKV